MKKILLIISNFREYRIWKRRIKEEVICDFKRGCGYYLTVGYSFPNPVGRIEKIAMKSGKTSISKLLSYKTYSDPSDMIKESYYQMLGYENEKLFKDMTFEEYLDSISDENKVKI